MEEKRNTKYILRLFIPILILDIILFVIITGESIKEKQTLLYLSCLSGLFLIFGVQFYIIRKRLPKLLSRWLQSESPQPLISFYENYFFPRFIMRIYKPILPLLSPLYQPNLSFKKAFAYTYWGQFDAARDELLKVEWGKLPPMAQSSMNYIEALLAYLERNDFQRGLELAQEGLKLQALPSFIPSRKKFDDSYSTLVEIGQILNGNLDATILASLEKKFKLQPVLSKLLVAWALEKAYNQMGNTQQAEQMRAFLNETAPHCVAFAKKPQ